MAVVTLLVESHNAQSERRFQTAEPVGALRTRLEPVVGIPAADQRLTLHKGDALVCELADDSQTLGSFPIEDCMVLRVAAANPAAAAVPDYNDVSQVDKFVMDDSQYDQLGNSVRAFKRRHNLGRFADAKSAMSIDEEDEFKDEAQRVAVGSRCEVSVPGCDFARRGTVRFVGKTKFRKGYWVGVEYDEPVGMNNGTVDGTAYFACAPNHGSFVRPDKVATGEFPEEDLLGDDLEEM
ncbi:hypothetical protein H4R18_001388 [Coemansia javaensis]|uniref:CAP-Gly domain-containing protein n=1 Tax=Coemansia javaensis TaxID=2761396 RepID=A0A9W8HF72_9FUNG|nr:hypothetical protein H4R18_001388 [Coemansia javaensis]